MSMLPFAPIHTAPADGASSEVLTLADRAKDYLLAYGPNVVWALLTLVIGWWIAKALTGLLRRALGSRGLDATLVGFLSSIAYATLMVVVVISALGKLGVPTTSFVAVIGAAGLAIGFALQGSLANFAAGVMVVFFRPFRAGDFIEAAGITGKVEEVQIFSTILTTPDNKKIIVPNSSITGGNIVNYSAKDTRRVDFVFGVGYGDDLAKARQVIQGVIEGCAYVLEDPAPVIAVHELGDSSVNFVARPWVKSGDYWACYWEITEKVKLALDAAGISIPFPQRDVHLHQVA